MASAAKKRHASAEAICFFDEDAPARKRRSGARRGKAPPAAPIPFITFEGDRCAVADEAAEFLERLDSPLAVVGVAGLYRTGKSFLLNRALLRTEPGKGFQTSASVDSCTKGIWLYRGEVPGASIPTIILDTEGLGAVDTQSASHDSRVFALALLLSSSFVYNSIGSIDETALNALGLVLKLAERIRKREGGGKGAFAPPHFTWVVRDFSLRLAARDGREYSACEYLESALEASDVHDSGKSRTRATIRELFPRRHCATLVRPCDAEEMLHDLDAQPADALRPDFVSGLAALREKLFSTLTPLCVNGAEVTGPLLVGLARAFVGAVNRGAVPHIADSWKLVCDGENRRIAEELRESFRAGLAEIEKTASSSRALQVKIAASTGAALAQFAKARLGGEEEQQDGKVGSSYFSRWLQEDVEAAVQRVEARLAAAHADALREIERESIGATLAQVREKYDALEWKEDAPAAVYASLWVSLERVLTKAERAAEKAEAAVATARLESERAARDVADQLAQTQRELSDARREAEAAAASRDAAEDGRARAERAAADAATVAQAEADALRDEALAARRALEETRELLDARCEAAAEETASLDDLSRHQAAAAAAAAEAEQARADLEIATAAGRTAEEKVAALVAEKATMQEEIRTLRVNADLAESGRSAALTELEELRASAEAEAQRAAADAERVQKESLSAVADIKGVLDKERARAKRQRASLEAAAKEAEAAAEAALGEAKRETEEGRAEIDAQQRAAAEAKRAADAERNAQQAEIQRYGEMIREQAAAAAEARKDLLARLQQAGAEAGVRERELMAAHAAAIREAHDATRAAELRVATAEARHEASERRRGQLEKEVLDQQGKLAEGSDVVGELGALRVELEAVRRQKDDSEGALREARKQHASAQEQLRGIEARHRAEVASLRMNYEKQLSAMEQRLLEAEEESG